MKPARNSLIGHSATVTVNLDAIAHNAGVLAALAAGRGARAMAVVKADAYGHGLVPVARAALDGGAAWLGAAQAGEALALRQAGVTAPLLTWLYSPSADLTPLVEADVDVSVAWSQGLDQVIHAASRAGRPARVHVKLDTGLGRGGVPAAALPGLAARLRQAEADGRIQVVGAWSHFAFADAPEHPTVRGQQDVFEECLDALRENGVEPSLRHLANSAATLTNPSAYYDLVRPGLALYGLSPVPDIAGPAEFGLQPAMSASSELALVKEVPAGTGVSYGLTYTTSTDTTLALVPLGYGDGVPRHGSSTLPVTIDGRRLTVSGRVCMDQFVVDVGPQGVPEGSRVVLFGDGTDGCPTAEDWARAAGTISYEIVTRFAPGIPRTYVGEKAQEWTAP